MTDPVTCLWSRVGGTRLLAVTAVLLVSIPSCTRLKPNARPRSHGSGAGDVGHGGAAGDVAQGGSAGDIGRGGAASGGDGAASGIGGNGVGGHRGSSGGSATGGTSSQGGNGGSFPGGNGSSGTGHGGDTGDTGGSGASGEGGGGGQGGATCVDACVEPGAFACSSATHVHRCVDEGDCSTWHDVIECPDGFSCCGGLCIPGDSAVARCSMGRLVDPEISVPVGMGYWCSVDLANRVDSDLAWASVDPCADLKATHSGASIARAGLYSTRGTTAGLGYCGTTYTGVTYGVGDALLRQIRSDTFEVYADCHYLFSPVTMPIFQAPFPASEGDLARYHVQAHAGFDFAVTPKELDVSWFGPSSGLATIVDHYGQDRSSETQADDDDGRDWAMDAGTPIYAVASGRVVASRERVVARGPGCASSETRTESEIYVQHDVGHGSYRESFVTYYGHLQDRLVAQGSVVTGGALIGHAGHAGCAAEDGLHFAVTRLTNTIGWYQQTFTVDATETGDNGRPSRVEPFGWAAGDVDPWGWRYVEDGKGAWSPQLWKNENPPPDGRW